MMVQRMRKKEAESRQGVNVPVRIESYLCVAINASLTSSLCELLSTMIRPFTSVSHTMAAKCKGLDCVLVRCRWWFEEKRDVLFHRR
jgi:hypothetical protein